MERNTGKAPDASKPCFNLLNTGRCTFGKRCRFSHDPSHQHDRTSRSTWSRATNGAVGQGPRPQKISPIDGKLREWKLLLNQGSQISRPGFAAVSRFFQLGLDLMDGDAGASQEAIKSLVTEAGLSFVKDATERHVQIATEHRAKVTLWMSQISPLFRLITHPRVIDSAVLEQEIAAIYNFILGVGARRMSCLFAFITSLIDSWPTLNVSDFSRMSVVELSLAVLSKILDCNTTNIVNDHFSDIATSFSDFVRQPTQADDEFSRLQSIKYLEYIKRRLDVGNDIPTLQGLTNRPVAHEIFVLRRDLPGHLSADGPRHDNDHADISNISIMPTYEEVISPRAEYLPTNDPSQWHMPGIRGRLDREFRLLREDTIGQLRDAVQNMLRLAQNTTHTQQHNRSQNGARTYTYDGATVQHATFDHKTGMQLTVRCSQPDAAQKMGLQERRSWWDHCKRLQPGALVCILDASGSLLFFVVAESTLRTVNDTTRGSDGTSDHGRAQEKATLSEDQRHMYVDLQLVDTRDSDITTALQWYRSIGPSPRRYLVEFPGVLLASFKHTLAALQQMHRKPDLPFTDLVAPTTRVAAEAVIPPPQYASRPGFEFDLGCLSQSTENFSVNLQHLPSLEEVTTKSGLDLTQSEALLNTLSRQLSLIQGPPGTGKSFTGEKIIKVLLANKRKASLGPILCVCYTNHALDQLLEHLLDEGIDKIIRIGSRSKSERLQGLNLRAVAAQADRTKAEKYNLWQLSEALDALERETHDLLRKLSSCTSGKAIKDFLAANHPAHHHELHGRDEDEDGFEEVRYRSRDALGDWLRSGRASTARARSLDDLSSLQLASMTTPERAILYRHWLRSIRDPILGEISGLHAEYVEKKEQRDRVRQDVDLRCLQQADVVGVTTTGLARALELLRKVRCKVMLCEEAGEVLEAHILTAFLPSVEHAILIGDHLQLRPQIQNYELQSTNPRGEQYSLDLSLFERLVQPPHAYDLRLPVSVLETQRRMHPSIAEMVRSTLYGSLKDADNVRDYPAVMGMRRRLFWFDHEHLEARAMSEDPSNTSHSNDFEIEMTAAFVSHLVRQGEYKQGDIAVITPYLGQLHKLRKRMSDMFEIAVGDRDLEELEALDEEAPGGDEHKQKKNGPAKTTILKSVRLATVDNFQGEEAKVVIISLVRSNAQNKCGFLSTPNRINVLLSRAKHGCYIIGNSNTCNNVPMWTQIISLLQSGGNFGTALALQCPRHPDTPILVSEPDHFGLFSPDGGCNLPCDKRLDCGHSCLGRCHSNVMHSAVKCLEKCPRPKKGCDHACPRVCGEPCEDKCHVKLKNLNLRLPCGHVIDSAQCWETQDPASIRCQQTVTRTVPGCNHVVKAPCYVDVDTPVYACRAECGHNRQCGHTCRSPCYRCNNQRRDEREPNHGICQQVCERPFTTCRHTCRQVCHGESKCKPCMAPCDVRCSHSRCSKPCHEPCAPCAEEKCASSCPHTKCTMPCAAPCDWVPCSRRCELVLACGHRCPSLCGETCPDPRFCQQCGTPEIKETIVDYIEMEEYVKINLDEDPCIFPDCGHFLTMSSMDGQMSMADHYTLDQNGNPCGIAAASKAFSMDEIKVCPTCRGSLRNISRYGRIVRRAMLDEATKKFMSWSNTRHIALAEQLLTQQQELQDSISNGLVLQTVGRQGELRLDGGRRKQMASLRDWVGHKRYGPILKLWKDISRYTQEVRAEEQPFQRVADFVKHANRSHGGGGTENSFAFDETAIQLRGYLYAVSLLLKCDIAILSDFAELRKGATQTRTAIKADFKESLSDCERLIKLARETDRPQVQVEGHIAYAQFCVFARSFATGGAAQAEPTPTLGLGDNPTVPEARTIPRPVDEEATDKTEILKTEGLEHIALARALLRSSPSVTVSESEVDDVEHMLNEGVFYRSVSAEEMRDVYRAMASEFSGTGHWYTCARGHPFTVGECGMPMEQARCPECGSPVGGAHHQPAEGVRRAAEIEEIARGVGNVQL